MEKMTPSQLATLLRAAFPARLPVLIVGQPGIAKTSIVRQVAAELGADLILSTPSTEDPTEPKGFPWANGKDDQAHFKPFGNLAKALAATKLTIWFLDDFGQAPPSTQSGYMPLLQGRTAEGEKLPECVVFVAATNRRTDRAGVGGLLEPVKSRFATIVELVPDLDEWCQWALQQPHIPPELIAYHRFKGGEALCEFTPSADLVNCPLPRTWENAGRVLALNLPQAVEAAVLAGTVGEGRATEFLGFRTMFQQLPSIDGILLNPDQAPIPENLGALYATVTGLAAKTNESNFGRVAKYVERLVQAARGDFGALCVKDAARRAPKIQQTTDFVRLMAGDLGQLISGTTR